MFSALGRATYRRRRAVLAAGIAFLLLAGLWGTGVFGKLVGGGFEDPGSESARAAETLVEAFGRDSADVVVLYTADDRTVDDPTFRRDVEAVLAALPEGSVTSTSTFWSTGAPSFVSEDRRSTFAVLGLPGDDDEALEQAFGVVADRLDAAGLETAVGGAVAGEVTTSEQVGEDIARAEMLSLPVLAVLLVVVFGGLVAAGLPLLVGGFSVLGAFLVLQVLSYATDLSVFALNIVTLLGLGLAIDYSLFMVSRFREELAEGRSVPDAVERTVATAGRTVAFSGLIVTVALAGLLVFPQMFLQSMGLGGMAAVTVAAVTSLTVLPAVLGMLGDRVNALRLPFLRRRGEAGRSGEGWHGRSCAGRSPSWSRPSGCCSCSACRSCASSSGRSTPGRCPPTTRCGSSPSRCSPTSPGQSTSPLEVAVVGTPDDLPSYVSALEAVPGVGGGERARRAGRRRRADRHAARRPAVRHRPRHPRRRARPAGARTGRRCSSAARPPSSST